MAGERLGKRGRRRDRIPGADRRSAVDGAERGGRVSFDEDAVANRVGMSQPQPDRAIEVHHHPVAPEMQRVLVGVEQLLFALVLLGDELLDFRNVHVDERGQRPDIDDVLEQLALARVGVFAIADGGERHADDGDVVAEFRLRHRLGRVIEEISARLDAFDVLVPGLRVHGDHEVGAAARAEVAGFRDADLVPGRQPLNVRRENVARSHRNAHAHHRASK